MGATNRILVSRPRGSTRDKRHARGGTLVGIFVGLVLGLAIAAAVAYYLGRTGLTSPIQSSPASKEPLRTGKADTAPAAATPDKPRFDFYKILPGAEEPKVTPERKSVDKATADAVPKVQDASAAKSDRAWLQAGAFTNQSDAENLKARLAMSGWEAVVQSATMADKSVRYRVRLGPFASADELNRIKSDLGKGGFEVAVIKNP